MCISKRAANARFTRVSTKNCKRAVNTRLTRNARLSVYAHMFPLVPILKRAFQNAQCVPGLMLELRVVGYGYRVSRVGIFLETSDLSTIFFRCSME